MTAAGLNDWKTIRRARREKRRQAREIARRKREIGARALIGYAFREELMTTTAFNPYLKPRPPYGKDARARKDGSEWPTFV